MIQPGQQLLHYRLIDKIGEGGMGVVWSATDTSLDREVAIKVLPQEFSADAERLARFEREAKLLASLNHPHIASVYGLHNASTPSGDVRFIAMEMIGGEDLSDRLTRGPMTPARALAVASQIAEGLSAAHEAGVIHRDLKPANIKLTSDGKVKVLDFGLAKAFSQGAASGDGSLSNSPTMTVAGTMAGAILGTASYMSPEQARGKPTDRRTDMWAFGALLFEMLTGRKPFPGEVISEIIAKIIERDPDWNALPTPLHPGLRRLLERCLTKDPARRLRDAADARLEIEELLTDPTGERLATVAGTQPAAGAASATKQPAWLRALPWAIAAAVSIWAIAATVTGPASAPAGIVHFEINPPTGYQFSEFATAPDGSAVAFVGSSREAARSLWVRRLDSPESIQLDGTEGAWFPFWSPDSRSLGFFSSGKLRTIDLASETIRTIADAPNGRGGAWSHDGTILFTPEGFDVLHAVPASGGASQPVTTFRDDEATHRFPHFVEGSRRFVYSAHGTASSRILRRYLGSLDSDEVTRLEDGLSEIYVPPDHALYVRETTLLVQPFHLKTGSLTGTPFPLARNIEDTFPRTARSAFSVSDNGVLMYLERQQVDSRLDAYDRRGQRIETIVSGGDYGNMTLSGDRRQILFTRYSAQDSSIWRMDLSRKSETRLLLLPQVDLNLAWSADGRRAVYSSDAGIQQVPVDGGTSEWLVEALGDKNEEQLDSISDLAVSPDGRFVAFSSWDPVTDFNLWMLPLTGEGKPILLSDAGRLQSAPSVSPDSRWIAYHSNESGSYEVYVRAVPGSGSSSPSSSSEQRMISAGGGSTPVWSEDGRELYYVSPDYGIMAVTVDRTDDGRTLEAGIPVRLFDGPLSVEDGAHIFFRQPRLIAVADGRFLFQVPDEEVRDSTIEVVLNWEQRLPDGD